MKRWIKKYNKHYLMLLPFFTLFLIFVLYPIFYGIYISFHNWDSVHPPTFIGINNFINILKSESFLKAFGNLLKYVSITIPLNVVVAFGLALLVNSYKGFWSKLLRSLYFLPTMLPLFLGASVWRWLYAPDVGFINTILSHLGIEKVLWLTDPNVMIFSLIIVDVWISAGFNMIILLAGMQDIPQDYYEAAKMDGANFFQETRYITIPQLEPVFFLVITYGFISALQVFDAPWILSSSMYTIYGGPQQGLLFPVMDIMGRAFGGLKFGQAAAYGIILTIFILLVTLIQFSYRRKSYYFNNSEKG